MIKLVNASQIVLERAPLEPNGELKMNVDTATVRVYSVVAGSEVDALASQSLINVRSNVWRYIWEPVSLSAGQYRIEYTFDDTIITTNEQEDLEVLDMATATALAAAQSDIDTIGTDMATATALAAAQSDITDCKDAALGNRVMDASGLETRYREDGITELGTYQYNDVSGDPSTTSIYQRIATP